MSERVTRRVPWTAIQTFVVISAFVVLLTLQLVTLKIASRPVAAESDAVTLNREAVACILDQLADHRLENAAAHRSDAVDHDYALEEKGVEADPRRVEQLVNPEACAKFLEEQ